MTFDKRAKKRNRSGSKKEVVEKKQGKKDITTVNDLIEFIYDYISEIHEDNNQECFMDWQKLWNLIPHLQELNNMVGMEKIKSDIIRMVMFLAVSYDREPDTFMHSVIYGKPGVGKTHLAGILGKIYCAMGFLEQGHVITVKRTDLIGKYIGHSEAAFKKIMERVKGGVLLIDEAYSFGGKDGADSFAKAVIDLLNQHLSEDSQNFVCIIVGYENDIDKYFFSINQGLKRRFPWKFYFDDYTPENLADILYQRIKKDGWEMPPSDKDKVVDLFKEYKKELLYQAGDVVNLFVKSKLYASERIFINKSPKHVMLLEDLAKGFQVLFDKEKEAEDESYKTMFL